MGDSSARFVAEFYLARIYAADAGPAKDPAKAFVLYRKLADENLTIDPLASQRAPFVAKALIALAGYMRAGVKEIDLAPNPRRSADYLHHAAVFFGDRDAQLELARDLPRRRQPPATTCGVGCIIWQCLPRRAMGRLRQCSRSCSGAGGTWRRMTGGRSPW